MVMRAPPQVNRAVFGPRDTFAAGFELLFDTVQPTVPTIRTNGVAVFTPSNFWSNDDEVSISVITFTAGASGLAAAWRDGSLAGTITGSLAAINFSGIYALGTYAADFGNFSATMTMGEFIVMPTAASSSQRQLLEGYLAHRWGAAGSLPINHPYKTTPPFVPEPT